MSKILDYMQDLDLLDFQKIENYFLRNDLNTINSFVEYICHLAFEDWVEPEYSPYSFMPSMDMSGFGGCGEFKCKTKRASTFSKFSSLYGDTVYLIVNSITNPHLIIPEDKEDDNFEHRYALMCDFSLICLYSDLIRNNIAKIIPPQLGICPDCFAKYIWNEKSLSLLDPLIEKYTSQSVVNIVDYYQDFDEFCVEIKNLPELFPNHNEYISIDNNDSLPFLKNISSLPYTIEDFSFKYELIKDFSYGNYFTSKLETFISTIHQAKYITSQILYKDIIDVTAKSTRGSILPPMFEMPFLENLDVSTILKIRENEHHAFNDYRVALDNATKEYIKTNSNLTAKEIYDDIIYPAFINLDAVFERTKKTHRLKNAGELIVNLATVTLGVITSNITENTLATLTALNATEALKKLVSSTIEKKSNSVNKIENQDFYFLWKLKGENRSHR